MSFFTDKWTIGRANQKELVLVRKSKRNLFIERISEYIKDNREVLTTDVLEEYDVALASDTIYIIYQNTNGHLILNVLREGEKEEILLTPTGISEVFNLSLGVNGKSIHILYTVKGPDNDNKYIINHHCFNGTSWQDYVVDEIRANKVLNPMKTIVRDDKIFLVYYGDNKEISLKEYNIEKSQWSSPIKLIGGDSEKLFLDMLIVDKNIHLTFCEYVEENLVIKYFKFAYQAGKYEKTCEEFISNEGSPSHPTAIFFRNKLWIVWLEVGKLFSRSSDDGGQSWGPIYMWNNTKNIDFVRYKYVSPKKEENICLDYSFGSIYPEIEFLGFGPTNYAVEVPIKKKDQYEISQNLKDKIEELENKIRALEESIYNIEDYLVRRSRGYYYRSLKRPP